MTPVPTARLRVCSRRAAANPLARLAGARPPARDGRAQRDAGFVLRRRPVSSIPRPPSRMPAAWSPRAPTFSTSARNRPVPMAARRPVSPEEEMRRLEPVLPAVLGLGVPVSIDTMKAQGRRLGARRRRGHRQRRLGPAARPRHGARGRRARRAGHRHAQSRGGRSGDRHHGRHRGVLRPLARRSPSGPASRATASCSTPASASARRRSRASSRIARLAELKSFGLPLLVGASRKRFIDTVSPAPPDRRLGGSIAAHLLAVENGAAIVRVHDVAETVQALKVAAAIRSAR